jgi:hypothetical protein
VAIAKAKKKRTDGLIIPGKNILTITLETLVVTSEDGEILAALWVVKE